MSARPVPPGRRWLPALITTLALSTTLAALLFLAACANVATPPVTLGPPTPTPHWYTVAKGDTLFGIAKRFDIEPALLIEVNEIDNPNLLQPGQQILISDRVTVSGRVLPTVTPTPRPCVQGCKQRTGECSIKAFRAQLDNMRLYVLPADELYPVVEPDLWFCREDEVQAAGWVRWTPSGPATTPP